MGEAVSEQKRVGVIGCGLIAQVMHLPYLRELEQRFEIAALCDLVSSTAEACAERYGSPAVFSRWQDLLDEQLDAVLILSSGDHAPIAIEAARRGLHVFAEKPLALCAADGARVVKAAEDAGVRLMVGTMKRYDPAYERLRSLVLEEHDLRLVRVTTLESPFEPYVAHYPLIRGQAPPAAALNGLREDENRVLERALGDVDQETRWCYRWILLDNLVHELNALRGILGEPSEVTFADLSARCASINLRFGEVPCHLSWVDLPGIASYRQEFAFYAPKRRLTLTLPSPFLRNMPSMLTVLSGEPGSAFTSDSSELISFEEAFKRELIEFSDCMLSGREPRTSGHDALGDLRLCEAVARAHLSRDRTPTA